jgi:hypothetical protein
MTPNAQAAKSAVRLFALDPCGRRVPVHFPHYARHLESICGPVSTVATIVIVAPERGPRWELPYRARRLIQRLKANGYGRVKVRMT